MKVIYCKQIKNCSLGRKVEIHILLDVHVVYLKFFSIKKEFLKWYYSEFISCTILYFRPQSRPNRCSSDYLSHRDESESVCFYHHKLRRSKSALSAKPTDIVSYIRTRLND